jgi:hypothetical protein
MRVASNKLLESDVQREPDIMLDLSNILLPSCKRKRAKAPFRVRSNGGEPKASPAMNSVGAS